jgi:hypothetical protein
MLFMIIGFDAKEQQLGRLLNVRNEPKITDSWVIWGQNIGGKKIVLDNTGQDSEKHFRQLCRSNPDNTIHWISLNNNELIWQQLYDPDFYEKHKLEQIAVTNTLKQRLLTSSESTDFIFSGLSNAELYTMLKVSDEEKSSIINSPVLFSEDKDAKSKFDESSNNNKERFWLNRKRPSTGTASGANLYVPCQDRTSGTRQLSHQEGFLLGGQ